MLPRRTFNDAPSIAPIEAPSGDADYSALNIGGASGAGGTILEDGRVQYADGRIRTPGGYAVSVEDNFAAGADLPDTRQVLGFNRDGSAYFAGNGGFTFHGLQTDTSYPVAAKPSWLNPAGGLSYSFDSAGQTFWRDNLTGEVMSPLAPYSLPTKSELEAQEFWGGVKGNMIGMASNAWDFARTATGMYFGDTDSWKRSFAASDAMRTALFNATPGGVLDSVLNGTVNYSPVGIFDAMRAGQYGVAGDRATGVLIATSGTALGSSLPWSVTNYGRLPVFTIRDSLAETGFASDWKLLDHFDKHGGEFRSDNVTSYFDIGRDILDTGREVSYFYKPTQEVRRGFVSFMRNSAETGESLFGFVGTDPKGYITTIHTTSREDLFKLLGDPAQSKFNAFKNSNIGPNPQFGWKYPYSSTNGN